MKRKNFESQEGQSLILIALMMVAMVGMLGLALDGGRAFASRRASQNAADSAAFGAVRLLASKSVTATEPMIWDTIVKFAKANGVITTTDVIAYFIDSSSNPICKIPNCRLGGQVPTNATGVRVTTTLQMQPYFIDVLIGKQTIPIPATAAAQSGPPAADLMPMTLKLPCSDPTDPKCFQPCTPILCPLYQLMGDPTTGGNFQWTDYDEPCSQNAQSLADFLMMRKDSGLVLADPGHHHMSPVDRPYWVCGSSGESVSKDIRDALDWWLARPEADRHWVIPVFDGDPVAQGANTMYHVYMFADFVPMAYDYGGQSNPKNFSCTDINGKPIKNGKCIMGKFYERVEYTQIQPAVCGNLPLEVCGIGMSQ